MLYLMPILDEDIIPRNNTYCNSTKHNIVNNAIQAFYPPNYKYLAGLAIFSFTIFIVLNNPIFMYSPIPIAIENIVSFLRIMKYNVFKYQYSRREKKIQHTMKLLEAEKKIK